ncbi:DUF1674 domain-containing protein [Methylomonas montana]|uniref:DUF1674 domain-containing protein n=1 Tax=Methylomonas montana TaxID=3058963 RepID=UPI00265977B7|nr:succinate dehydrogenase assembly factor 4 [Methylomonas montana]WKJ92436.1 DUF1674 domain-containing protein [Methylomonas montana]
MKDKQTLQAQIDNPESESTPAEVAEQIPSLPEEINGPKGPEPTRFGDWERKGRCVDF